MELELENGVQNIKKALIVENQKGFLKNSIVNMGVK